MKIIWHKSSYRAFWRLVDIKGTGTFKVDLTFVFPFPFLGLSQQLMSSQATPRCLQGMLTGAEDPAAGHVRSTSVWPLRFFLCCLSEAPSGSVRACSSYRRPHHFYLWHLQLCLPLRQRLQTTQYGLSDHHFVALTLRSCHFCAPVLPTPGAVEPESLKSSTSFISNPCNFPLLPSAPSFTASIQPCFF